MATPEWTAVDQGLRSQRIARCSIVAVLVGLGVLAGIGIGIPIGREQQAQVHAQGATAQQRPDQPSRGFELAPGWLPAEDADDGTTAGPLPAVPDIATLSAAQQRAFNRFHCDQTGDTPSMQCTALAVLQVDSRFEPGSASAPTLLPGGADGTYRDGERMALAAKASSEFDGYLYVDYFDSEGNVVHLRPGRYSEGRSLQADAWVDLGGRDYIVCPPFGTDLVIAISTPLPIFESERPIVETGADYLRALHARLQEMGRENQGMRPASGYTVIVTSARDGTDL
jgi:Domain of unknown function (DUF4384)